MNQAVILTASSGLFQMEVWGVRGEANCIRNLPLLPPPHSQPSPLCVWTVAQPVGEAGRRQGNIKQGPSISHPGSQSPEVPHL